MILRPPRSTRTDTLFPYTPLFLSPVRRAALARVAGHGRSFPKRWARPAVLNAWMDPKDKPGAYNRSEEHTSELQSLMRTSYAVFCLKKKNKSLTTGCKNTPIQMHYSFNRHIRQHLTTTHYCF